MDLNDLNLESLFANCKIDLLKAFDMLKDSKIIRIDEDKEFILIWYGGHGIHVYDFEGDLRYFYNTGSFEFDSLSEGEAIKSMENRIKDKDYKSYEV
jgi:hypothetical protein